MRKRIGSVFMIFALAATSILGGFVTSYGQSDTTLVGALESSDDNETPLVPFPGNPKPTVSPTVAPVVTPVPTAMPIPTVTPEPTVTAVPTPFITEAPKPTVAPVVTPVPTNTPVVTPTSVPVPTDTPVPTTVPKPTATPVPSVTKPSKPVITSVSNKSRQKLVITWKKVKGAKGYELYRRTGKKGSYKKLKVIKSGSTLKYTNSKLKKGTAYYYKIRAYKYDAKGKKVYGGWSAVKGKTSR
ncbi:hypothetical protein G4952_04565 [Blautia wexlerae]|uniref:Fibronectin type-III domain-containing protein n=1 Tax=Blautia wexlerae TaxID=418240 RepID=A0ABX2GLQ7_9FIRM|nr:hypothetical protein [Blautia wexlerae]NSF73108.1 hypothetical protein [Blautia wexlerae]